MLSRMPCTRMVGLRSAPRVQVQTQSRLLSTLYSNRSRTILSSRHAILFAPSSAGAFRAFSVSLPKAAPGDTVTPPASGDFQPDVKSSTAASPELLPDVDAAASASASSVPDVALSNPGLADTLSSIPPAAIEPLQYGDLAALGIASWSPAGLSAWLLELVNVTTSLPWFWTIIAGTFVSRALIFPFAVRQIQQTSRLAPFQPRLAKLRDQMNESYARKDMLNAQRLALQQRKVYEEAGVSMLPMFIMPFIQLPVTLGMFFGVRRLCTAPLEQLHWSGVWFLPDLTVADPYYVLPILSAVLMNFQLSYGMLEAAGDKKTMGHMVNAFRIMSVVGIPIMGSFPSGLSLYVTTGVGVMILQSFLLRSASVRRLLNIPPLLVTSKPQPVRFQDSIDALKKFFRDQKVRAEQEAAKKKW
ncbi:hypothetical protein DENSPDRAFT_840678 [Dentipellis sp. KUC8613]|nr:hypothetical protein DENSPDRAFT_840678 [Dentipellis sp. KUC8613]